MSSLEILDYWTNVAIDAIWKEQVQESIKQNNNTGNNDEDDTEQTWELVECTPSTEPS